MTFYVKSEDDMAKIENITECLRNICAIPEGSMPLNRGVGLSWALLDGPPIDMENEYTAELAEKVEQYEPRVKVTRVSFSHSAEGESEVTIEVEPA